MKHRIIYVVMYVGRKLGSNNSCTTKSYEHFNNLLAGQFARFYWKGKMSPPFMHQMMHKTLLLPLSQNIRHP
jgi:hypothetical protein